MLSRTMFAGLLVPAGLLAGLASAGDEKKPETRKPESSAIAIGTKAPLTDRKMENVDGRKLSLADVKGEKGTLVLFSCNHCPWVVKWEERIAALGNEYPKKGIGWIAINSNDLEAYPQDGLEHMKERAKQRGFNFPYVVDDTSDLAREFGAMATPEAFLFDADWKLVYHGAIDDDANDPAAVEARWLKDAMDALIEGKEIAKPTSKAIGCSIKLRKGAAKSEDAKQPAPQPEKKADGAY